MKKGLRLGVVLFLVAVAAFFAFVRPQMSALSESLLTAKARNEELSSYQQRLADVSYVQQQGESVQATLKALYLAMPSSSQVPEALVMIESLGASTGINFSSASFGQATESELPVSLAFSGDLTSVSRFMDGIYDNIRTVVVKSQTISADESGTLSVRLELGLVYRGGNNGQ